MQKAVMIDKNIEALDGSKGDVVITGSEKESRELMMNAAISIVAEHGFEGFTTKKWAQAAGVAEGSLYYHFKGKNDLLNQTFQMIDNEIVDIIGKMRKKHAIIRTKEDLKAFLMDTWKYYYHFLMENKERTIYFYRFRSSSQYNQEIQKKQCQYFKQLMSNMRDLNELLVLFDLPEWELVWSYLFDTTATLVFRALIGGIEIKEETVRKMSRLFLSGICGFLYQDEKQ